MNPSRSQIGAETGFPCESVKRYYHDYAASLGTETALADLEETVKGPLTLAAQVRALKLLIADLSEERRITAHKIMLALEANLAPPPKEHDLDRDDDRWGGLRTSQYHLVTEPFSAGLSTAEMHDEPLKLDHGPLQLPGEDVYYVAMKDMDDLSVLYEYTDPHLTSPQRLAVAERIMQERGRPIMRESA